MKKEEILKAFGALDAKLEKPLILLIGGGSAMLLAHNVSLSTHDVDGLPLNSSITPAELDKLVKVVASELSINGQWYNDYFNTFTYALPPDFKDRLVDVFKGKNLLVKALGAPDLLIMKCFAGREKDIGHARALLKRGADYKLVERHIEKLMQKGLPGSRAAFEFLEDLLVEMDDA